MTKLHNPNTRLLLRLIVDFVLLLITCAVALLLVPQHVDTVQQGFFCSDQSLQFEYAPEQSNAIISKVHMTILVIALPPGFIVIVEMLRSLFLRSECQQQRPAAQQQYAFLGVRIPTFITQCYTLTGLYVFGLALTLIVIELTKRRVARLRPYFLQVCEPEFERNGTISCAQLPEQEKHIFIADYQCRQPLSELELLSLQHSLPSDYATAASYAMTFSICYLQHRFTLQWLALLKAVLQTACFLLATLVAYERVASLQHHYADVIAGLLLGAGVALFIVVLVAKLFDRVRLKHRALKEQRIYSVFGTSTMRRRY